MDVIFPTEAVTGDAGAEPPHRGFQGVVPLEKHKAPGEVDRRSTSTRGRVGRGGVEPPTFRFSGVATTLLRDSMPRWTVVGVRRRLSTVADVAPRAYRAHPTHSRESESPEGR
ncbi:hypothetical protein GCM10023196_057530 [Actinoallomurus vinaceus]|uniref:Uncharacterized protein n=1 Tax=Actinoallomurus vinaceus TaxID=1080074 RepID=A0ABP8UFB1_9ACTN